MDMRDVILKALTPEPYDLNKKYNKKIKPIVKKLLAEAEKIGLPIVVLSVAGVKKSDTGPTFDVRTSGNISYDRRTPYTEVVKTISEHPDILIDTIKKGLLRDEPGIRVASELESLFSCLEAHQEKEALCEDEASAEEETQETEETPEDDTLKEED